MAVVQQYLFGSNREYYFMHVEQSGQNSFYSMYSFDSDGNMYVSFEDRRFQNTPLYADRGAAILKINPNKGQIIWQKSLFCALPGTQSSVSVDVDSSGNVYHTGTMEGEPLDTKQVFVQKYNSSGVQQWIRTYCHFNANQGTTHSSGQYIYDEYDIPRMIFCNGTSSVTVLGREENPKTQVNTYLNDYATFVTISSSGSLSTECSYARSTAVQGSGYVTEFKNAVRDSSGNFYVVGLQNNRVGYSVGLGITNQNPSYLIVMKLNSTGIIQWQKQFSYINSLLSNGGTRSEDGMIAIDTSGNTYTIHRISNLPTTYYDTLIIKSNSSGTIQWVRRLGPSSPSLSDSNYPIGIVVDPDDESYFYVLVQKGFTETSSWGTNKVGYCLVKYNSSGSMQWQRVIVGQAADGNGSMTSRRDNNVGHGSGKLGSFYIQNRGIVFSFSLNDVGGKYTVAWMKFPLDTYVVGDWTIPIGSAGTDFKLYIRDMSTGINNYTVSSYSFWQNGNLTRYNGVGSAPGKSPYSQTSYATGYDSSPTNSDGSAFTIETPQRVISGYHAGIHNE
tara:strand:+ start:72 stop:1745 length:1674 start_codon:yes stop_codon:yes gene_type:complete